MTPWTAACQTSLSITNSQSLLKLMSIESVMPSNISSSFIPFSSCLQSCPASWSFLMSQFFASGGPKYWSFSFNTSSPNEYSGAISFKMTGGFPCSPRDSQESPPTPQLKSINSSALSFLHLTGSLNFLNQE